MGVLLGHDLLSQMILVHLLDPGLVDQEGVVQDVQLIVPDAQYIHLEGKNHIVEDKEHYSVENILVFL